MIMKVWKGLLVLSTVGFCLAGGSVKRQTDEECDNVSNGINAILRPCRTGTIECIESQDFDFLGMLLCTPRGRTNYNALARCRGQDFADQIYATVCSGPGAIEPTGGSGSPRCFELVRASPGVDAFQACCRNSNVTGSCDDSCRTQLQALEAQLACCTQTSPYVFYFETCGNGVTLQTLYASCNVTLPHPCEHLFSPSPTFPVTARGCLTTPRVGTVFALFLIVPLLFVQ